MPTAVSNPDLPEPTASGTFAKTPLPHLLVYAHDRELTGTFEFSGPTGQTATVLFIEGQPTKARTTEATVYLGRVLFELGIVTEEQLGALLPRLLGGKALHGQVLMAENVITEEQLELGLRAQLVRQMKALVHLPAETTYKYYDSFDALADYGGDGHVGIDPFALVWACIRDEPPWEHIHLGLTSIGTASLRLTAEAETTRFAFDKAERATVELLRQKPARVHDLTAAGTMAPRLVQLLVYCLLVTKQVELVHEPKVATPPAADASSPDEGPSSPHIPIPMDSSAAALPRTVARVQLAQRAAARAPSVIEEAASKPRPTPTGEDGKTSYVATQPRSFNKKRTTGAEGIRGGTSREGSSPELGADPPAATTAPVPPMATTAPAPPIATTAPAPPAAMSTPAPAGGQEALTAPPPPLPDAAETTRALPEDDVSYMPTPALGMPAVDIEISMDEEPAPRSHPRPVAEVHTRPTVPKLDAVSPAQIAAHLAAVDAKKNAARSTEGTPPSSGASRPPSSPRPASSPTPASAPRPVAPPPSSGPVADPASGPRTSTAAPVAAKEEHDASDAPLERDMPMTDDLIARKKEIQDKAAAVDKEDYFTLLGVARDTPTTEVQKAFFVLAKKWHPDRVPAALADVKDLCAKVFARMSEAHQTLMDATKRAKYESSKKAGADDSPEAQAQVMAILEAAQNFQKAEICLKRNDFKQAEEFCKKAIAVEPKQADYIAMLAWLDAQKPQRQDAASTQAQIVELTRAISISQACERAFFYRATLLKRIGQTPQAMKDFKRAMELNPRNVDAQREVRLYNMRGGEPQKPAGGASGAKSGKEEGGGIFGKLFKK